MSTSHDRTTGAADRGDARPGGGRLTGIGTLAAKGSPWSWRAVDIVTLAIVGVAFGVAFWGFDTVLYAPLSAALGGFPPAQELLLGVWLIPCVVGYLLVRRPGSALLVEISAASVEALLGNKWGMLVLVSAVLQALGVEIVAAIVRWRRAGAPVAMAGGAAAAVLAIVLYEWHYYVSEFSLTWKLVYLLCGVISGVVIAGLGGLAIVRALAATGAVNAFPAGEELIRRRMSASGH